MREIMTGRDIGTTIDFRSLGTYDARHPWPEETIVSGGQGIVFTRSAATGERSSYSTPFIEVYPPDASFIRGEGETPAACEDAAWAKYQLALNCSDNSGTHHWEPRGYLNGAGFCSRCDTFGSQVFTGEQLGQFCRECGAGTTYHTEKDGEEIVWLCKEHAPKQETFESMEELLAALFGTDDQETGA
ncbi:hypothetical protein [Arthrobacter koreensis]|uniref:hypothetical protein n=1 Tax=Arthrobacter koreensis TaxID=199136 RepID=UPI0037F62A80